MGDTTTQNEAFLTEITVFCWCYSDVKLSIITLRLLYPSAEIGHWPLIAIAQPQPGEYTLAQKPPPRGVFQVLMKVVWLPMVLKKATSLHSGRSVMTHNYVARPVQEVMHSFCSCSCSDVVTTLLINCCRYWTYHEMTTTRLIPPGLLSLYRLHTWPLNRA